MPEQTEPKAKLLAVNTAQQEAIHFTNGTMLVLAGPGSGKTYVITQRIKYLIEEVKITPGQILVITFTKAAALEMKNRCIQICKGAREAVFGTFHSVFYQILKQSKKYRNYTLITSYEKQSIMRQILSEGDYDSAQLFLLSEKYLAEISLRKNMAGAAQQPDGIAQTAEGKQNTPKDGICAEEQVFLEIMRKYQEECECRELLDFDDMLLLCHRLFMENKEELKRWQSRFQYLLVDEFQDVNSVQYEMTRLLANAHGNLFVVGDDDQAIYAFRGSNPAYMRQFLTDFPSCRQVVLSVNYRCGDKIIETAARCISHNKSRFQKKITAGNQKQNEVQISGFASQKEEVDFVCEKVAERVKAKEKTAILLRTNSKAEVYAEQLYRMKIPYQMKEKRRCFYEQPLVLDFLAILRFAFVKRSRQDFFCFMNKPTRYISRDRVSESEVDFERLRERYIGKTDILDALDKLEKDLDFLRGMDVYGCISYILYGMKYQTYLRDKFGADAEKLAEANETMEQLKERGREFRSPSAFLDFVEEYRKNFAQGNDGEGEVSAECAEEEQVVQLMTFHGSKGLEFDTVFLPDINRGQVPHGRMLGEQALEEERRMFYVAMTRAKSQLYITYVSDKQAKEDTRSVFLSELDSEKEEKNPVH